jgi:UDP-N-acetylglucosamine 4,6-dehydratase/5-epimerase
MITGGTGSFGRRMTRILLEEYKPAKLIIFSRDELKQHEMQTEGFTGPNVRYFIGDVRDYNRLKRAMRGVDIVVHAAALKQVMACEYNPIEAINTNIMGARNIVDAALDTNVRRVIAIGTDKAVDPINLYGATKLAAEKLVVDSNSYSGDDGPRFSCTRYGNVVGSRGSVVPLFQAQRESGRVTVTDAEMTRFWITLDQGVRFVMRCIEQMQGGEVFVPKLPSMNIVDVARAVAPDAEIDFIGPRPGEKIHEALISRSEARNVVEMDDVYIVKPIESWWTDARWDGMPVSREFAYTSDTNDAWLVAEELQRMIAEDLAITPGR